MTTAFLQVTNNASSPLAVGCTAGDGTITVTSTATYPAAFPYDLSLESEIVRVTAAAGPVLTVTRGVQGTLAASHASGVDARLHVTAKSITDLNTAVNTLEGYFPLDSGDISDFAVAVDARLVKANLPAAIAYEDESNTFTTGQNRFTGDGGTSQSTGGSVNVTTTGHTGAGAIVYSNRGADAAGRLVGIFADNPLFAQNVLFVRNDGTGITVSLQGTNIAGDEVLDVISSSLTTTVLGVRGENNTQGVFKLSHLHPAGQASGSDADAALLRLNWETGDAATTAVQGIYAYSEDGSITTGDLIEWYNGTSDLANLRLRLAANGDLTVGGSVTSPMVISPLVVGGTAAAGELALQGSTDADPGLVAVNHQLVVGDTMPTITAGAPLISVRNALTIGGGGGLRGYSVSPAISITDAPLATSFLMFNFSPQITSNANNMQAAEIFKFGPAVNSTSGVAAGTIIGTWATFKHNLALTDIGGGGSATATSLFVLHPTAHSVGAGWTVSNYGYLRGDAPTGSGTITNFVGIRFAAITGSGPTYTNTPIIIQTLGTSDQIRFAGPMRVGATGAPTAGFVLDIRGSTQIAEAGNITVGTTTGTKIGTATTQKLGFYNATPIVQPSAYTQTYSTADKTHANATAATVTDNSGGTANTTLEAISAAYVQSEVRNNFADLAAQHNAILVDLLDLKQLVNSIIDDLQALGLVA